MPGSHLSRLHRVALHNITTIKSHHNVGGLPEKMNLKLCEPLRLLFKDEVRAVGRELGMPEHLIKRHPFLAGLAVRILGDITPEKVRILQDADDIFIQDFVTGASMTKYGKPE